MKPGWSIQAALAALAWGVVACAAAGEFDVYPSAGVLNPRVPVIAPVAGGASGRCVDFELAEFSYVLAPHLDGLERGALTLMVRDAPRRSAKEVVSLRDGRGGALALVIPAAKPAERRMRLQSPSGRADSGVDVGLAPGSWRRFTLDWCPGRAELSWEGGAGLTVPLPDGFVPTALHCRASLVDEIELRAGEGRFRLDWENGYAARIVPQGPGGVTARLFGFDAFVVGDDPARRDYPMTGLVNSTGAPRVVEAAFVWRAEQAGREAAWTERITVPAGAASMLPIRFPRPLATDAHHLEVRIATTEGAAPTVERKHFLYVARRGEPAGPGLFGLHDSNVDTLGFWPDALPLRYAHKYLRWGWVVGPAFVDGDPAPERDPDALPEEWNWNASLDWALAAGREMFVSLQSFPYSNWYRERVYATGMKPYPCGQGGGFPRLDAYARFLESAVARYRGRVRHYEIENEPNAYHMPDQPEDYARVAAATRGAVKRVDPAATVYGICGTGAFIPWMKKALDAGAAGQFDVLSYHTYTTPRQPDRVNLRRFIEEVKAAAPKGTPLFNSETGVLQAFRYTAERPIPAAEVAAKTAERATGFVTRSAWPGRVCDEWEASASILKNAVINLASGSRGFIFFGWNPQWPKADKPWTEKDPDFSLLSITPEGERTPSLTTLAVGVLTAEFEGVDPAKGLRFLDAGDARGAEFGKAGEGRVAVLWSDAGADVLALAPGRNLEVVSLFGQRSRLDAAQTAPDGRGVFRLPLSTLPVYVHGPGALEVVPSPFGAVEAEPLIDGVGKIVFAPLNTFGADWNARLVAGAVPGLTIEPTAAEVTIRDKRRRRIEFVCHRDEGGEATAFEVPFTLRLPTGLDVGRSVRIASAAALRAAAVPDGFVLDRFDALPGTAGVVRLDRTEQAVVGRPSDLASLQEDRFWGGPDELSAETRVAVNDGNLFVAVRVRDRRPRPPVKWPGVFGSCVELFFDFRGGDAGLGSERYADGVYQFLLSPALAGDGEALLYCPQRKDFDAEVFALRGGPTPDGYWLGLTIPWARVAPDGRRPARWGFDVGVNGPSADGTGRKTQLMAYGTEGNHRDASRFATVLPPAPGKGRP